jgi:hypothetical protein
MKSLVITDTKSEEEGEFYAYISNSTSVKEAQERLDGEGRNDEVIACILIDESNSPVRTVGGVIDMALDIEGPNDSPYTVRAFLLGIFMAGRNSVKQK